MNVTAILTTIKEHKPKLDRSIGRFGLGQPWQVRIYVFSISLLLMGYLIAGPAIFMHQHFPGFITIGLIIALFLLGTIGLMIWGASQIPNFFSDLLNPTDRQIEGLKRQLVDEETLVAALTSFEEHDLEFAKKRLLFEITYMDFRSQFFLGTSSKIAVVPFILLSAVFVRQLLAYNPFVTTSYCAMGTAGLIGLLLGALVSKQVASTYQMYCFLIECAIAEKRRLAFGR